LSIIKEQLHNLTRHYTTAASADDTAIVATDNDPTIASSKLQIYLLAIRKWLKMWRMKVNESKSTQVTFTTCKDTFSPVYIKDVQLPQEDVKYFKLHLIRRLT
jgi:hypothetical protein